MKIRRSTLSPSLSSWSSSSFSSSPSSPHSTLSTHSLTSSSNSTFSFPPLSSTSRCHGLDLLVKAVYHVAGSVVGVPYIQRRVIRRRKPAVRFARFATGLATEEMKNNKQKRRSWKQGDRRRRKAVE